jgi:hypothetical protein
MPYFTVVGVRHLGDVTVAAVLPGHQPTETLSSQADRLPGEAVSVTYHVDAVDAVDAKAAVLSGIRWNNHRNDLGDWCPWSGTPASPADLAEADQLHEPACPAVCRDSHPTDGGGLD